MENPNFNIDTILDNIKSRLKDREEGYLNSINLEDQDLLELTEVVSSPKPHKKIYQATNNKPQSINGNNEERAHLSKIIEKNSEKKEVETEKTIKAFMDKNEKTNKKTGEGEEINKIKLEKLIREELRVILKEWMSKDLIPMVREEIRSEVTRLTSHYFK